MICMIIDPTVLNPDRDPDTCHGPARKVAKDNGRGWMTTKGGGR